MFFFLHMTTIGICRWYLLLFVVVCCCDFAGLAMVIEMLLDYGAKIDLRNRYYRTALHIACQMGHQRCCKILVEHGASPNVTDKDLQTPLHLACLNKHHRCINLLLNSINNNNNNKNDNDNDNDNDNEHDKTNSSVIRNNTMYTLQNGDGLTSLMIACKCGSMKSIQVFVKYFENSKSKNNSNNNNNSDWKSYVNMRDWESRTALHHACLNGHSDICQLLLKNNANPFVFDSKGKSCLHIAAENGYTKLLTIFVNACLKLSIENNSGHDNENENDDLGWDSAIEIFDHSDHNGNTPLHLAAMRGHKDCEEYLVNLGVNYNILNSHGYSPHTLATFNGNMKTKCPSTVDPYSLMKTMIFESDSNQNQNQKQKQNLNYQNEDKLINQTESNINENKSGNTNENGSKSPRAAISSVMTEFTVVSQARLQATTTSISNASDSSAYLNLNSSEASKTDNLLINDS